MSQVFRLFWLRETGCDAGTPLRADELEPEIRERVLALAASEAEITLHLPYLDRHEWRKRGEILSALPLERRSDSIFFAADPARALRDAAATFALTHPAWLAAPEPNTPEHFPVWQNVSMTLQRCLRAWIPEQFFEDIALYQDRKIAYPMLVYQAAHVYHGRARDEFTYNFSDYPQCRLTLALALKMTGRSMQAILARVEKRLNDAGMQDLARRYAPVWYQDIVEAVRQKPKTFIALLAAESAFINAVIELSLNRTPAGVNSFSRSANQALRKVYGMDLRPMGVRALELAAEVLASRSLTSA